jgi:cytoskeletal protein CcmA (bactofilin family)
MGRNQKTTDGSDQTVTVIAHDAVVRGRIEGAGEIIVHGSFEGEIISSASLMVAPTGVVYATIRCDRVYINGYVRGTLHSGAVHLDSQARFVGDVHTPSLRISEGAVFHASCSMPDDVVESPAEVALLSVPG